MNTNMPNVKTAIVTRTEGDTTYHLFKGGALYAGGGSFYYLAGYVSHPDNVDSAIFNHQEEMAHLMAQAKAEFGAY